MTHPTIPDSDDLQPGHDRLLADVIPVDPNDMSFTLQRMLDDLAKVRKR